MLVLCRRLGEKIVLPGLNVTIQVLQVQRDRVRIGIEAPRDVIIMREELLTSAGEREQPAAVLAAR